MRNDTVNSPTIAIPGSSYKGVDAFSQFTGTIIDFQHIGRKRAREDNGSAPETPKKRGRKSLKGEIVDLALGLPSKAATSSRMSAKAATAQLEGELLARCNVPVRRVLTTAYPNALRRCSHCQMEDTAAARLRG